MNKQQLAAKIWASANKMRSKIEANEYKDYILGFIFYKFLSDKEVRFATTEAAISKEDLPKYLRESDDDEQTAMVEYFRNNLGYFISYDNLFTTWLDKKRDFDVKNVSDALSAFERLIHPTHQNVFKNIFNTLEVGLKKLGATSKDQTAAIKGLLNLIKDIPMDGKQDYDVLGFIYEYLIGKFAANAGKKAGEFYTPHEVSVLMSEIVANHLKDRKHIEIYDPTSGSGSLLINIGKALSKYMTDENGVVYYAQELKENTYNLTRMNLVMRGIIPSNIFVRNGDTLKKDWPFFEDGPDDTYADDTYKYHSVDAVVSNPPYSQPWEPKNKNNDPRFKEFGVAPKGKADYAFLLHDLYHLKGDGVMTIVLPHGVLFRGTPDDGSEGSIRKELVEGNHIEAIIGLPSDIFYGTGIPTLVMVLRKQRADEGILLVDASSCYIKQGKKNVLRTSDIKRIVDVVRSRESKKGFSCVVSKELIRKNDYNLNLPRYISSTKQPETWDIYATMFGGIPNSEIDLLNNKWEAMPGLRQHLFTSDDTPFSQVAHDDIENEIIRHPSVIAYKHEFARAMQGFDEYLFEELLRHPKKVNITAEEPKISEEIFSRLKDVELIDSYDAYQLLDDEWSTIATDLEIIQTEGMDACFVVDPNMVTKKKDNKEIEVQEGWLGRVLPFELVQQMFLKGDYDALCEKQKKLNGVSNDLTELVASIAGYEDGASVLNDDNNAFVAKEVCAKLDSIYESIDTDETKALEEYLTLTKKNEKLAFIASHKDVDWSIGVPNKDNTYSAKAVQAIIKDIRSKTEFEEDTFEYDLVKAEQLLEEEKRLKSECKKDADALHLLTKKTIEEDLNTEDAINILQQKWIAPVVKNFAAMPDSVVLDLCTSVKALIDKYATTMVETEQSINETERDLNKMLSNLVGNDFDMKGIGEIQKLFNHNDYE